MPPRIARLPLDPKRGLPVPWFVAWIDGQPDFRIVGPGRLRTAEQAGLCWICGQALGSRRASFVIGPMCAVNRVSSEPPSHHDCATYAAVACPFLANPERRRRESRKPEAAQDPAGTMIRRNPGVALVWVSRTWKTFPARGGLLWDVGEPETVAWYAHGRTATRDEVLASIDSGLPLLRAEAESSQEPEMALAALEAMHSAALALVPAEVAR